MNENLSLDLRFMNFALRQTTYRHHGYDDSKLKSQGTTPTHVVYSRISTFDLFLQNAIHVALSPDALSQICQGEESDADVLKVALRVVSLVLEIEL